MTFLELSKAIERRAGDYLRSNMFAVFSQMPFWLPDPVVHNEYREISKRVHGTPTHCCFNHFLGLPRKHDKEHPIYDYEVDLLQRLEQFKHLWILKSTGLGITEICLRYLAFKACKFSYGDYTKPWTAALVTGPNLSLAVGLIDRLKRLFASRLPDAIPPTDKTVAVINGIKVEAFPSHHVDAMRSLENPKFILIDESDYFPAGQQAAVRDVAERYIAKSDPLIAMVSTPNAPNGLMQTIEQEEASLYHKVKLHYTVGLGKIYTEQEIAEAQKSPSFPREYGLQYIGKIGNVFLPSAIDKAVELGRSYNPDQVVMSATKSLGVDPAFGSSRFALVAVQTVDQKIQVIFAEEFERPSFSDMIYKINKMVHDWQINSVYVDAANPAVIRSLKTLAGERADYESVDKSRYRFMKIKPVAFGAGGGREMLGQTKILLEKNYVAINPIFSKLIISLRTAVEQDGTLLKEDTSHDDIFDAFRLALSGYRIK